MKKIEIQFNLPVTILKENKRFVAYSPALDLSTSGKSHKEVQKRFVEIAKIFFEEIIKKGTMDDVLSDLGWHKAKQEWQPPILVSQELEKISLYA